MSQTDFSKLAYSIGELADKGPIRRSSIYNQIASGRLRARKIGRRTVVLDEDWRAFLASAPVMAAANSAAAPNALPRRRGRPRKASINPVTAPIEAPTKATATATKVQASHTPDKTGVSS
ncbi:MAG TPA: hypothetical protein VE687_15080 [Stellaceae bacterium]|nr:hypothetical protein [Stellaceae bacterium]